MITKMKFSKLSPARKLPTRVRQCLICGRRNVRKGVVVEHPSDARLNLDVYSLVYCDVCVRDLARAR